MVLQLLQLPTFLQNLPAGWTCHLDESRRRVYYHNAVCGESVWFAVQCVARRAYQEDVSVQLRGSRADTLVEKIGVQELYFRAGDRIMLISSNDDVWWEGELAGKVGIFPSAFVRVVRCSPIVEIVRAGLFKARGDGAGGSDDEDGDGGGGGGGGGAGGNGGGDRALVGAGVAADSERALVNAMSTVQLRALLHSCRLPWNSLSEVELRPFCAYSLRPEVQAAMQVSEPPPNPHRQLPPSRPPATPPPPPPSHEPESLGADHGDEQQQQQLAAERRRLPPAVATSKAKAVAASQAEAAAAATTPSSTAATTPAFSATPATPATPMATEGALLRHHGPQLTEANYRRLLAQVCVCMVLCLLVCRVCASECE
jgi:hypothetical protein